MKKIILLIIALFLIAGIWFPMIPFVVKDGWHGIGGEWCGIVYNPECENRSIKLLTYREIQDVWVNHRY